MFETPETPEMTEPADWEWECPARGQCPGDSVGLISTRTAPSGVTELLMIEREWWPIGWACIAGHVKDAHADAPSAVVAEASEEAGVRVTRLRSVRRVWLPNLCQSPPWTAPPGPGHLWELFEGDAEGDPTPAPGETSAAAWVPLPEVQALAEVTMAHALAGGAARDLPRRALEAVWVEHLAELGYITATAEARRAVARLYTTPPDEYWIG
ncbi:NUDIX domain-containing protein [Nocardiopsis flavescens]|uniref:NUDIX domain-containing protein n=1 Tax=Nocardiopsis flavescens TaxID=758803 RepID=A0A1M6WRE8_9ACTN|nr:NUDIX domain-containing protein [Nocardiopsis flavescens]SHK96317.1 NUDIX domain-containing protein [Nocardiopsis flavescens]